MKKILFLLLALSVMAVSCKKTDDKQGSNSFKNGVFIVNQGNFNSGNASLSFFNASTGQRVDDVFFNKNHVPLGDVAQSITIDGDMAYIVVNNSGKIYAIDNRTAEVTGTISNLVSPRYMLVINEIKAYVSDLYTTKVTVVNPSTYQITGDIEVGRTTEEMVKVGDEVFAANWSAYSQTVPNNMVLVINTTSDMLTDSIRVGIEPNSMVVDKNKNLWVLCSGGYTNDEFPTLWKIDAGTHQVLDTLTFDVLKSNPGNLEISGDGDFLFYLNGGIYKFSIDIPTLPTSPLIEPVKGRNYSFLGIDPVTGDIYASDPLDYQRNGNVYRFNPNGILQDKFEAGIIPGAFGFNYN